MSWIKNGDKFFNIALARTGEAVKGQGGERVRLINERGDVVGIVDPADLVECETVIAGPLAAVFVDRAGEVQWRPVVAWRVSRNSAEPVLAGSRPPGVMFIEFANGELLGNGQRYYHPRLPEISTYGKYTEWMWRNKEGRHWTVKVRRFNRLAYQKGLTTVVKLALCSLIAPLSRRQHRFEFR
jgi:hypothetical protein